MLLFGVNKFLLLNLLLAASEQLTAVAANCIVPRVSNSEYTLINSPFTGNDLQAASSLVSAGVSIDVSCLEGYSFLTASGQRLPNQLSICQANGSWLPALDSCWLNSASIPLTVSAARPTTPVVNLPVTPAAVMELTTTSSGPATRPVVVMCQVPTILAEARFLINDAATRGSDFGGKRVSLNTVIVLQCPEGFEVSGGSERSVCMSNRNFEPTLGQCTRMTEQSTPPPPEALIDKATTAPIRGPIVMCVLPTIAPGVQFSINNGVIRQSDFSGKRVQSNTNVTIVCPSGFAISGGSASAICLHDTRNWNQSFGVCTPQPTTTVVSRTAVQCPNGPTDLLVLYGYRLVSENVNFNVGATRTLACVQPGLEIQGGSVMTCLPTGEWTLPGPCRPAARQPGVTTTTTTTSQPTEIVPEETTEMAPEETTSMSDSDEIQCTDGPTELLASFGYAIVGENLNFSVGATRTLRCIQPGFEIIGPSEVSCQPDGEWTFPGPCLPAARAPVTLRTTTTTTPQPTTTIVQRTTTSMTASGNIQCSDGPTKQLALFGYAIVGENLNFSVGATRTLRCIQPGYEIAGPSEVTCQPNGDWTFPGPCLPAPTTRQSTPQPVAKCRDPATFLDRRAYSILSPNVNFDVGANRTIGCIEFNTSIVSGFVLTCQSNGQWSTPGPCVPLSNDQTTTTTTFASPTQPALICPKRTLDTLSSLGYVLVGDSNDFSIGAIRRLACGQAGFEIFGTSNISCLPNGRWSDPGPCRPALATNPTIAVRCSDGPTALLAAAGYVLLSPNTDFSVGAQRQLGCVRPGFEIVGASVVTCQPNGQWSSPGFCQRATPISTTTTLKPAANVTSDIQCPNVPEATLALSGYRLLSTENVNFSVGATRQLGCMMPGFEILGSPIVTCLPNGLWTNAGPCAPARLRISTSTTKPATVNVTSQDNQCPDVPTMMLDMGGYRLLSENTNFSIGATRRLACRTPGFVIFGAVEVVCTPTGQWSTPGPCIRAAPDTTQRPTTQTVSSVLCPNVPAAVLLALGGYVLRSPENANFSVGSNRTLGCTAGFVMEGPSVVTCQSNGEWTNPGQCKSSMAGSNGLPSNLTGAILGLNESSIGSLLGQIPNIQMSTTLQTTKSSAVTCPNQIQLLSVMGYILQGPNVDFSVGATRSLACRPGLQIVGASTVTCQPNGLWTSPGQCRPASVQTSVSPVRQLVRCADGSTAVLEALGFVLHSENSDFSVGATRMLGCKPGFIMNGPSEVVCLPDGTWSNPGQCRFSPATQTTAVIQCRNISTQALQARGYTIVADADVFTVGAVRTVKCTNPNYQIDGYDLGASANFTCLPTGQWSILPLCRWPRPTTESTQASSVNTEVTETTPATTTQRVQPLVPVVIRRTTASLASETTTVTLAEVPSTTTPPPTPSPEYQLSEAIASNNTARLLQILSANPSVNVNWQSSETLPASCRQVGNASLLIRASACNASVEIIRQLVDAKAQLNLQETSNNYSALHYAVISDNLQVVDLLLEKGATVDSRDANGWTPLMWACSRNNLILARRLIAKGADINARSNDRQKSPLILVAAHAADYDDDVINFVLELLNSGVDTEGCTLPMCSL